MDLADGTESPSSLAETGSSVPTLRYGSGRAASWAPLPLLRGLLAQLGVAIHELWA